MYEETHYEKPFLKEVIVRIDYASPIPAIGKAVPLGIATAALQRFPILEERKALAQELMLSPAEIRHKREEYSEWNYYGRDRQKRLMITPSFLVITYSKYTSFEDLQSDFISVTTELFKHYTDIRAARLGLRYINHIDEHDHDPLQWDDLVDPRLLGLFKRFNDESSIVNRIFHIVEFKYEDDIQMKFQFGVPNPDFPAPIRAPLFVLDIDAYYDGPQTIDEIRSNLVICHERIQDLFEKSITDRLRGLMNGR